MFIRSQNLFLRPVFPEDWRAIYRGMSDEGLVRMLSSAPWPYGVEDALAYCDGAKDRGPFSLSITLPHENGAPLVGQIGLADPEEGDGDPEDQLEIGYWVAKPWRGRGIAVEAVQALLGAAKALGVKRVGAGHFLDNPASGRVLSKCGFTPNGELRPTRCEGRGGEMLATRRYCRDLLQIGRASSDEAPCKAA